MKKIMMLFLAAMLLLSVSGQAMAAFQDGDLIRVVYTGTGGGTEYATDLGNYSTLTSPGSGNVNLSGNNFTLASVGASSWDQVYVAYFMVTSTAGGQAGNYVWVSGPTAGQTGGGRNMFSTFTSNEHSTAQNYGVVATGSNATVLQSDTNSYFNMMNKNGAGPGQMNGFIPAGNADQNLAALSSTGYVDQQLYYYALPNAAHPGLQVATLRTYADGHTEMNPTPIPATLLLFGSGLLGLVGIRRKQAA